MNVKTYFLRTLPQGHDPMKISAHRINISWMSGITDVSTSGVPGFGQRGRRFLHRRHAPRCGRAVHHALHREVRSKDLRRMGDTPAVPATRRDHPVHVHGTGMVSQEALRAEEHHRPADDGRIRVLQGDPGRGRARVGPTPTPTTSPSTPRGSP